MYYFGIPVNILCAEPSLEDSWGIEGLSLSSSSVHYSLIKYPMTDPYINMLERLLEELSFHGSVLYPIFQVGDDGPFAEDLDMYYFEIPVDLVCAESSWEDCWGGVIIVLKYRLLK